MRCARVWSEAVVEYAVDHPEVDLLHVWLNGPTAAITNANARICRQRLPADWYVTLLQQLDAALSARGCAMRIVFFGLFRSALGAERRRAGLAARAFDLYVPNSLSGPPLDAGVQAARPSRPSCNEITARSHRYRGEFLSFLQGWQRCFTGDSVLFRVLPDGIHRLPCSTSMRWQRLIHGNIRQLRPWALDGLISCQFQRVFFPVGVAMYVMGQTLWDDTVDLDALLDDYFYAACGADSALCKEFLKVSAEELQHIVSFGETLSIVPGAAAHLVRLRNMLSDFAKVVERNLFLQEQCHARSWHYLRWYLRLFTHLLDLFTVMERGLPSATCRRLGDHENLPLRAMNPPWNRFSTSLASRPSSTAIWLMDDTIVRRRRWCSS